METFLSVIVSLTFFGIICGQMTSAQPGQRRLTLTSRSQRGKLQQARKLPSLDSLPRRREPVLPGPRHTAFDRPRVAAQRQAGARSRLVDTRPVPTGSNRLRSDGSRRTFREPAAVRLRSSNRQQIPARTSNTGSTRRRGNIASSPDIANQLRIFARNLKIIDRTKKRPLKTTNSEQPLSDRSSKGAAVKAPLRIRPRLRQVANKELPALQSKDTNPQQKQSSKGSIADRKSGRSDMVAVDDIIALVKAIKDSNTPSPVQKSERSSLKASVSNTPTDNSSGTGGKNTSSGTLSSNGHVNMGGPHLDLLTQYALINSESSALNSLLADPMFLNQLSTGSGGSLSPVKPITEKNKKNRRNKNNNNKPKTSVVIHPSLLNGGKKARRKLVDTGNPVQDKMITSLLEQTMKNMQEDLQDNMV